MLDDLLSRFATDTKPVEPAKVPPRSIGQAQVTPAKADTTEERRRWLRKNAERASKMMENEYGR